MVSGQRLGFSGKEGIHVRDGVKEFGIGNLLGRSLFLSYRPGITHFWLLDGRWAAVGHKGAEVLGLTGLGSLVFLGPLPLLGSHAVFHLKLSLWNLFSTAKLYSG